jgi:MFS superfamily sulfate permease-like transporter
MNRTVLRCIFGLIFLSLLGFTGYASTQQPVLAWQGLVRAPDHWWTIATLMDAYFGFVTFYVWVFWKEQRTLPRLLWFVAIMLLGNMAMSAYMLRELARLRPDEPTANLLTARRA